MKWFAAYDVASQPRVIEKVLTPDLGALSVLALSLMVLGWLLDRTQFGETLSRSLDRVTSPIEANGGLIMRAMAAFFLISVWAVGGTILTPELKTGSEWVSLLQLAMAAALITTRTTLFTGFGIVVLYIDAVRNYGIFHLLDYPIFLAIAAYFVAEAVRTWRPLRFDPSDLIRFGSAITLMWASIEKWAYPEWTLPIYLKHPGLTMGYDFSFFMQAAGVIEFALAFALLGPPLVRRSAAFMLLGMFISAIVSFGKVDAIGHSMIIAVLLRLAADGRRRVPSASVWRGLAAPTIGYAAAFVGFLSLYYGLHAVLFRTAIG